MVAHSTLQPEESAAKVEREEKVKNEPNLSQVTTMASVGPFAEGALRPEGR